MSVSVLLLVWMQAALGQAQWRVLLPDGQVTAGWGASALAAEVRAQPSARSVWLWSWRHAPVAIAPGAAVKGLHEIACDGPFWLEARLPRRTRAGAPGEARVVAAPVEMWRELPESDLPSWPIPTSGRFALPFNPQSPWRVRLIGAGEGGWWVDLPAGQRSVLLSSLPTGGLDVTVLQPDGKPAEKVRASVAEASVRQGTSHTWALLADRSGRLTAPGLPDEQEVSLTLFQAGFPPLVVRGWPSRLPRKIVLKPGAEVTGRLLDKNRRGIAGAAVEAEFWVAQSPRLVRLADKSKADGTFALRGLSSGRLTLTLRAPGFASSVEPLELAVGERRDLGVRVLEPGRALDVEVRDEAGQPVSGAEVEAGPGLSATSDAAGRAEFVGVPLAPLELRGTAPGHQPASRRLQPPLPPRTVLELRRGFVVRGRLLAPSGVPVAGGTLRLEAGTCANEGVIRGDGRFEEDFPTGKEGQLVLRSPSTRELRLSLTPGAAGEVRDLGDLTAPGSPEVTGTVVSGRDGNPVAGARIWLPRPGPQGPTMAWGSNDLVEAASGEDGRFHLLGLAPGPVTLRVEAAGYARASFDVAVPDPAADSQPFDIGTITLGEGGLLRVHVDPSRFGPEGLTDAVARVDLRRQWLAADMLSAQVWNGEAEIPNVPPGAARMSVIAGTKILCEQDIEAPAGGELDVDCTPGALLVTGRVLVGGAAAGPGVLSWHSAEDSGWARVDTQVSPTGLRQQQAFAAGRPEVDAAVEADGTFQTRDLSPGAWRVSFQSGQGTATPELALQIPEGDHFEAVLPFAGLNVAGVVVTKDGSPASGAKISELASGSLAIARSDGSFVLTGLSPGKLALQARLDDLASAIENIEVSADQPSEPVRLVLKPEDPPQVAVTVIGRSGIPMAGAMVFFEEDGKGTRLLVTSSDGRALVGLEAPLPARVRAGTFANGAIALGDWTSLDQARQGLALQLGETGGLEVQSASGKGSVRILSASGWDLSWMMRLLGVSTEIAPANPLRLDGVPAGVYDVVLGSSEVRANVAQGSSGTALLP